ncbi:MAG: anthranilate synthase component I family protein [Nitrospirae bacterium]|nr:anthranilate synthase component I family protein [Nitrospirota bacterium]MBI3605949.1 anthranilate synthase component I family protein [Nitrospirota bacterium]
MGIAFSPVVKTIPYDSPLACFKKVFRTPPAFLLESAREHPATGRYSFIGRDPYLAISITGKEASLCRREGTQIFSAENPFLFLRSFLDPFQLEKPPGLPPFFGGAAGFFSYEMLHFIERLPERPKKETGFPDCFFLFVDTVIVFDHVEKTGEIIYFPPPEELAGKDWESLKKNGQEKISLTLDDLQAPAPSDPALCPSSPLRAISSSSKKDFIENVLKCQDYIRRGDIFQANLSQQFTIPGLASSPLLLYEKLRTINPAPFASFLDGGSFQVVSSSPERLVKLSQGWLSTRPIAGTRPRGKDRKEDDAMRISLITNEKERAEHMMLIDLERNDLGKISEYGSVKVDEMMTLENYSHVIHIVSNITGKLKKGYRWEDILKALFPGGTITGVPKKRAMEIIDELEPARRGPYTGSLGYISFSGELDFNILIRTLLIKDQQGYVQTGSGIVADSHPEKEYDETLQKAGALFKAVDAEFR